METKSIRTTPLWNTFHPLQKITSTTSAAASKALVSKIQNLRAALVWLLFTPRPVYKSMPLDKSRNEIRLVTIIPGRFQDPILCTMQKALLDSAPEYEALSYVWGEPTQTYTINVNGKPLEVTWNLEIALRHLRHVGMPRTLWIDAICIDQSNTQERNHQVQTMASIYREASRVLVWLGEPTEDGDEEMARLVKISQALESPGDDQQRIEVLVGLLAGDFKPWRLLANKWLTRIWTKQEIGVTDPSRDPLVGCGIHWITWSSLCSTVHYLFGDIDAWRTTRFGFERLLLYDQIRDFYPSMSLHWLLYITMENEATDPRDKVFALMGLSSVPTQEELQPDYTKSEDEVCIDTAVQIIKAEDNLRVLQLQPRRSKDSLPSWVPEITISRSCSKDHLMPQISYEPLITPTEAWGSSFPYATCGPAHAGQGTFSPNIKFSDDKRTLTARGLIFDTVTQTCDHTSSFFSKGYSQVEQFRQQALAKPIPPADIRHGLRRDEELWRIFIANRAVEAGCRVYPPDDYEQRFEEFHNSTKGSWSNPYETRFWSVNKGKRFFRTRWGFCGLGYDGENIQSTISTAVAEGDIVAILYGSEVPFILRPRRNHYVYVGECYVAGIMEGEFMKLVEERGWEFRAQSQKDFVIK